MSLLFNELSNKICRLSEKKAQELRGSAVSSLKPKKEKLIAEELNYNWKAA